MGVRPYPLRNKSIKYSYNRWPTQGGNAQIPRLALVDVQVVLHLQSKWRARVWQGQYLLSLRNRLQTMLEERLAKNR